MKPPSLSGYYSFDLLAFIFIILLLSLNTSEFNDRNPAGLFVQKLALKLKDEKIKICVEDYSQKEITEVDLKGELCSKKKILKITPPPRILRIDVREGVIRLPPLFCSEMHKVNKDKDGDCPNKDEYRDKNNDEDKAKAKTNTIKKAETWTKNLLIKISKSLKDIETPYSTEPLPNKQLKILDCLEITKTNKDCRYRLEMMVIEGHADQKQVGETNYYIKLNKKPKKGKPDILDYYYKELGYDCNENDRTCKVKGLSFNKVLSIMRAKGVGDIAIKHIKNIKIISAGFGCNRPIYRVNSNGNKVDSDCKENKTAAIVKTTNKETNDLLNLNRRIDLRFVFREINEEEL